MTPAAFTSYGRVNMPRPTRLLCGLWLACGMVASHSAHAVVAGVTAGALPAPARSLNDVISASADQQSQLFLLLVVNGTAGKQPVPVSEHNGHYQVRSEDLRAARVPLPEDTAELVDLDRLSGIEVEYHAASQQLRLQIPADWLPPQSLGGEKLLPYLPAQGASGMLLNYDIYLSSPQDAADSLAIWTEQRVFGPAGVFSNTGTYRRLMGSYIGEDDENLATGYIRYDTQWQWNDDARMIAYQAGDVISDSLTWSRSVRMGGIRISRNFGVRPDLLTHPTLAINGSNDIPSTVELFVNGYKASSGSLQSGPYTISNVPLLSGAGEATVVTTDALGRQVSTTVPFYVANTLLRPGLSDFDFSLGKLRQNYGSENFDYGDTALSAIYRRGLSPWLTLSGHVEAADDLWLGGLGSDFAVSRYGTVSIAASHGRYHQQDGWKYVAGYSYRARAFGVNLQHSWRDEGFSDLTNLVNSSTQSLRSSQASLSLSPFGAGNGNLSLGYYAISTIDHERTRLLSLSYSRPLFRGSSMYLSFSRDLEDGGTSAYMHLLIPLERKLGSVGLSTRRNASGVYSNQASWSRSTPSGGGWGWNLTYADRSDYRQASLSWLNENIRIQGGTYGDNDDRTSWGDVSGSLVWMDGGVFAANRISDAFVLVSTNGYPGVPVRYENRLIGNTNRNGHLLVPSVASYYPAKYSIDTLQLPVDIRAREVEYRASVREGSGALMRFDVAPMRAVLIQARTAEGKALPLGQEARYREGDQSTLVGHDSLLYFEDVGSEGHIDIRLDADRQCTVHFTLVAEQQGIQQLGTLPCVEETAP
jgi:outer membrane usher protein